MIHLDTNCLIDLVTNLPSPQPRLLALLNAEEKLAISAVAWSEFLNGPVTLQQVEDASGMLEQRIIPFGVFEAEIASKLFNQNGRKRGSQPDCFIAATAICSKALLATYNRKDFSVFAIAGLRLA
jgi:predicted nucleic acid-binding protein